MSEFGKDINAHSRKGVFIPDITVEMLRNAPLEGVEDLMASGEMEDISLPSAQPEMTRIILKTKAIPSDDDRVSLSETVTATYYDEEHEEWSRKIVTVRDVLDSVCDEYTVLPTVQPEIIRCKDCAKQRVCRFSQYQGDDGFCMLAERRIDE